MSTADDLEAIRRVLASYCQFCDDGRFDDWEQLFSEDATFIVMGRTHAGRPAIRAFIEAGQPPERRGKHITANALIELHDGAERATASTDYIFIARTGGGLAVTSAGRYYDELVKVDGTWLITSREIVFLGDQREPG